MNVLLPDTKSNLSLFIMLCVIWATNRQQNVLNKGYFTTNKGINRVVCISFYIFLFFVLSFKSFFLGFIEKNCYNTYLWLFNSILAINRG